MSNIYATYEGVKAGVYQTLVTIECYKCHILFAMPEDLNRRALSSPNLSFYCPLGHSQCYTETEEQRLKKKLEQEQARSARLTSQVDQARARAEHEEHRARAYKGQVTKIKKRVGKGVCPCCNRSFVDLARHMENKHPDYSEVES